MSAATLSTIFADAGGLWETSKPLLVYFIGGAVPLLLFLLTRRATQKDIVRGQATQVEQLYIGKAEGLFTILQDELRSRNARIGALEAERETLRSSLQEERQMFNTLRQRHRDLITLLDNTGVEIPADLHI